MFFFNFIKSSSGFPDEVQLNMTTDNLGSFPIPTVSYRWTALPVPSRRSEEYDSVPYQRYGHTAVARGECAYIWGGRNDKDGACNILFCFDTSEYLLLKTSPGNSMSEKLIGSSFFFFFFLKGRETTQSIKFMRFLEKEARHPNRKKRKRLMQVLLVRWRH